VSSWTTGKRLNSTIRLVAGRGGAAIEAPFPFHHGSCYYLFVSFDPCCRERPAPTASLSGRSTGWPYVN
jgi:arabinan endo-1,5-alpha-L-arabinosidase